MQVRIGNREEEDPDQKQSDMGVCCLSQPSV